MTPNASAQTATAGNIRLWPAIVLFIFQAIIFILSLTPSLASSLRFGLMVAGPLLGAVAFFAWLLFFSRYPRRQGLKIMGVTLGLLVIAGLLSNKSMIFALLIYGLPLATMVITLALILAKRRGAVLKLIPLAAGLGLILAPHLLGRIDGYTGSYLPHMSWRWEKPVEGLAGANKTFSGDETWQGNNLLWPEFRGKLRNSMVTLPGPLNWASQGPSENWRMPIGPGWSSFSQVSDRLFTQEQRGAEEAISCYDANTGKLIWQTGYESKFSEIVSGPGPRATPTYSENRIFAMGGKGVLSALNAADGKILWQHDFTTKYDSPVPIWGFSSSPLVMGDLVIVYAGAENGHGLLAFDTQSGQLQWKVDSTGMNYSSAQKAVFGDQEVLLFADGNGLRAFEPQTGAELWQFLPSKWNGAPMVQVQQIGPQDLLLPLGDESGLVRLEVTVQNGTWNIAERWFSRFLKPSFNDFVYHDGYIYGFDQHVFACIDAATGKRQWKRGRYGFGQVILVENTSQLVIMGEQGQVILLAATPEGHQEQGQFQAIEGKTWNHPIITQQTLYVRNGAEAASFALP